MSARNKGGRPAFAPTSEQRAAVAAMASFGVQHVEMAAFIGISRKTLEKHFQEELGKARMAAHIKVVRNLFRQATKDDPRAIPAAIYWTKAQMGWKEREVHEHTGVDGGPIEVDDARSKLADRIARLAAAGAAREGSGEPQPE